MARQAIDACLTLSGDMSPCLSRGEIHRGTSRLNERMAKVIVIEEAVHVSAKHAARCADGAIGNGPRKLLADNFCERLRAGFIKSFTHMDLIAREVNSRIKAEAEQIRSQAASNTAHGLFRAQHRSHGQKTEPGLASRRTLVLDTLWIFYRNTEHLKAAADADGRHTVFTKALDRIHESALAEPFKVVEC